MKRKGFTLLELLVVLGIMSIVLGIAGLAIYQKNDRELDEMLEDLRFARAYAVSHQKTVAVEFDSTNNRYCIYEQKTGTPLMERELQHVQLKDPHYIGDTLLIRTTGSFSKCGHIELNYKNRELRLNFTVGVARFTLTEP